MTLQSRLSELFPEPQPRGLRTEIAKLCGVSVASVSNWFGNPEKVSTISRENAEKLVESYRFTVNPAWLAEGKLPKNISTPGVSQQWPATGQGPMAALEQSNVEQAPQMRPRKGVPVVGEVKGGDDGYLDELQYPVGHGEGTVDYPTADPNAYALRVRGDSMHPRYRAGEFIVVEPSIEAQPGDDVVVALRDGRKLLKELNWERDGEVQLLSVNNHFGPLTIAKTDIQFIQLVAGRVRRNAISKKI